MRINSHPHGTLYGVKKIVSTAKDEALDRWSIKFSTYKNRITYRGLAAASASVIGVYLDGEKITNKVEGALG